MVSKQGDKLRVDLGYFHVTLLAGEDGGLEYAITSHWIGFESYEPLIERRVPSVVNPGWFISHWDSIGEPYSIVSSEADAYRFLMMGGHALIERTLAEHFLPFVFESLSCRHHGQVGFISTRNLPKEARNRAPTKKTRIRILKRDDWKCVICGRRPANYVDVELHVHHIRPWRNGGATVDDNLVTLCKTCHDGLEPHFELDLFRLTGSGLPSVAEHRKQYLEGVNRYRRIAAQQYEKPSQTEGRRSKARKPAKSSAN